MGFILEGLGADSYDREYADRDLVGRILRVFRAHRRRMLLVSGLIFLASVLNTAIPALLTAGVISSESALTAGVTAGLAGLVIVASGLAWLCNYFRYSITARISADVMLDLRLRAFDAVIEQDMVFFDRHPAGSVTSRIIADTESFTSVVTLTLNLLSELLTVVLLWGLLAVLDSTLALAALAVAPLIIAIALGFRRIARRMMLRSQRALAQVNARIQESLRGIAIAKAFRQESSIYREFQAVNGQLYRANLQNGMLHNGIFPVLATITGLGTALIIYLGGARVVAGGASLGTWLLFIQGVSLFWMPLTSVASFWSQFQQGLAASERIFSLLDAPRAVLQRGDQAVEGLTGRISFRNVDFHYRPGEPVLKDFSLDIPAGQKLAVVGHTGAGKSSLARLLLRFYEFQAGTILIDDQDIRQLNLMRYRRHIGVVPQVPFLFAGTVADNIRYGRPDASDAQVAAAAQVLCQGAWVADLPQGLQTNVGERGGRLSLGQRQLVALARVVLQDPRIFLLDEATASIDPLTEAQVQQALDQVMAGRTSIVIAHRLSTVRSADRILVLQQGRILEEGTHQQLLDAGQHYAQLYNAYFRHQALEFLER